MKRSRAFKTVKIKASSFATEADLKKMEELYLELEAKKTDAVEAARKAAIATANAQTKAAERTIVEQKIITMAAEMENRIAKEPHWIVYKDSENGDLMFEGITERLMRNTFRAQNVMLGKGVEDDNGDVSDMFENDEEE